MAPSTGAGTRLVFGADGGGTKTKGVVARGDGHIIVQRTAGPSNQNVIGLEAAARELAGLLVACCNEAGCTPADLSGAVLGLAGAGEVAERNRLIEAINHLLTQFGYGKVQMRIVSDARIALEGALAGEPGVVVIAGTGSVVMGKHASGNVLLVGGWGRILGDEGSGFRIGLEAVRAVTRELDGRSISGRLRDDLRRRFGWSTRQEIINAVYRQRFDFASIAPSVLEAADSGDRTAADILRREGEELAEQIAGAITKLDFPPGPIPIVFCGGLIDHETFYARALREAITRLVPTARIQPALHPAVQGAVLMALSAQGQD